MHSSQSVSQSVWVPSWSAWSAYDYAAYSMHACIGTIVFFTCRNSVRCRVAKWWVVFTGWGVLGPPHREEKRRKVRCMCKLAAWHGEQRDPAASLSEKYKYKFSREIVGFLSFSWDLSLRVLANDGWWWIMEWGCMAYGDRHHLFKIEKRLNYNYLIRIHIC